MDGNTEAPTAKLPTLLEQMESATSIAEFDVVESGLAEMETKFKGVVYNDIQTKDGLARAKSDRVTVKEVRLSVAAKAKMLKDPINKFKKVIDSQAERIIERVEALEGPIDEQIKSEERRLEEIKEAKRKAEAERVAALDTKVRGIEVFGHPAPGKTSAQLATDLETVGAIDITLEAFAERLGDAMVAKNTAIKLLTAAHAAAKAAEAQAAELEAFRKEKAERDAREEVERKAREKAEAEAEADRKRQAEIDRKQREEAQAEQRRIDDERRAAERAELERGRAALEAKRRELDDLLAAARAKVVQPERGLPVIVGGFLIDSKKLAEGYAQLDAERAGDVVDAEFSPGPGNADPGDEAVPAVNLLLADAAPTRHELILVIADHWDVSDSAAEEWLVATFGGGK